MIALGSALLLGLLLPQSPAADSLRVRAPRLSDSDLALEARARPAALREAVGETLARAARSPASAERELALARRLATAFAVAWRDSFLTREVARFAGWPPERRTRKVWADSVRRAGVAAYGQDGAAAAIVVWRRALSVATRAADTAGMAAILGNIGAGYSTDGAWDSAAAYLERARTLAASVGHLQVEANAIGVLADLSLERGDLAAAREGQLRALALRQRIGDTRGVAAGYNALGQLELRRGDYPRARAALREALAIYDRTGPLESALAARRALAAALSAQGDVQGALDELRRAQEAADAGGAASGERTGIALARAGLAVRARLGWCWCPTPSCTTCRSPRW